MQQKNGVAVLQRANVFAWLVQAPKRSADCIRQSHSGVLYIQVSELSSDDGGGGMNAREVIEGLKGCEGYRVRVYVNRGENVSEYFQDCVRVEHLPVDQRQRVDQGNVILWDGVVDGNGFLGGMTFWARDVWSIVWYCCDCGNLVRMTTCSGWVVIVKLGKIVEE